MKTEVEQLTPPKSFNPVALTITFETQYELDAFYAIFNHAGVSTRFFDQYGGKSDSITDALRQHEVNHLHFEFCEAIR